MSHIVTIAVEVRDLDAVKSACCRLELEEPVFGKAELFERDIEGVLVHLPDWLYPVVCELSTGKIHYDNFNNKWGDRKHLDQFVQTYCVEKATLEARRKGYSVFEQQLNDGSIKLTVNTIGGAV
jgi:hypothetical protein